MMSKILCILFLVYSSEFAAANTRLLHTEAARLPIQIDENLLDKVEEGLKTLQELKVYKTSAFHQELFGRWNERIYLEFIESRIDEIRHLPSNGVYQPRMEMAFKDQPRILYLTDIFLAETTSPFERALSLVRGAHLAGEYRNLDFLTSTRKTKVIQMAQLQKAFTVFLGDIEKAFEEGKTEEEVKEMVQERNAEVAAEASSEQEESLAEWQDQKLQTLQKIQDLRKKEELLQIEVDRIKTKCPIIEPLCDQISASEKEALARLGQEMQDIQSQIQAQEQSLRAQILPDDFIPIEVSEEEPESKLPPFAEKDFYAACGQYSLDFLQRVDLYRKVKIEPKEYKRKEEASIFIDNFFCDNASTSYFAHTISSILAFNFAAFCSECQNEKQSEAALKAKEMQRQAKVQLVLHMQFIDDATLDKALQEDFGPDQYQRFSNEIRDDFYLEMLPEYLQ